MRRNTVRATRPSGASSHQVERDEPLAARRTAEYWCAADHRTVATLSADAEPPLEWECRQCGAPAHAVRGAATGAPRVGSYRTPYEFLMMRRTPEDGEALLAEALAELRAREGRRG